MLPIHGRLRGGSVLCCDGVLTDRGAFCWLPFFCRREGAGVVKKKTRSSPPAASLLVVFIRCWGRLPIGVYCERCSGAVLVGRENGPRRSIRDMNRVTPIMEFFFRLRRSQNWTACFVADSKRAIDIISRLSAVGDTPRGGKTEILRPAVKIPGPEIRTCTVV